MSELPRRRLMDRLNAAPSVLSSTTQLRGDLQTAGPFMLNGQILGNGLVGGELAIAAGAHWEGDVQCAGAVVAGSVTGSLVVADKLEIRSTAVVRGRVSARRIAVARGAIIDGEMTVTGTEPVVEFVEKRAEA